MPKKNPKHKERNSSQDKLTSIHTKKDKITPKSITCNVKGCNNESIHSLSITEWENAISASGLELELNKKIRKFQVCKDHYKILKNVKKKEDKLIVRKSDFYFKAQKPSKLQGF